MERRMTRHVEDNIVGGRAIFSNRAIVPRRTVNFSSCSMLMKTFNRWREIIKIFTARAAIVVIFMSIYPCLATAGPVETYLALGDSIAFGETDMIPVSFGDQGYVKPFADFLATQNGGNRPNVISLAFPGETSSSFFTAIQPPGAVPHTTLTAFNLTTRCGFPAQSARWYVKGVSKIQGCHVRHCDSVTL